MKLATNLKTRHILMISLGSAIGTGLFFSSGQSIALAGPSIILAYLLGGAIMYVILRALGEMTVYEPNSGSFSYYAHKYIGNYAGFISGWNYWFNYIIVCMIELTASTIFLDYWFPNTSHWIFILIGLITFTLINLVNVKFFGEFEFWFVGIKVVTIFIFIGLGVYLILFGHTHNSILDIKNILSYNGFFGGGMHGFILSFVIVVFSFGGTELIGITSAETSNPKKSVPMAINGVIFRIALFYIATLSIIMFIYPWGSIKTNISPFVDVLNKIGISKGANIMNFVAITAALSSFNSGIYGTARMIHSLSIQGNAPHFLSKVNKQRVPYTAILFSSSFIFIAVILNYLYPEKIFTILLSLATIAAMINWIIIIITHFAFKLNIADTKIEYKMPLFPALSIIALIFFIIVGYAMTNMPTMVIALYIAPIWILLLSICYMLKLIRLNIVK